MVGGESKTKRFGRPLNISACPLIIVPLLWFILIRRKNKSSRPDLAGRLSAARGGCTSAAIGQISADAVRHVARTFVLEGSAGSVARAWPGPRPGGHRRPETTGDEAHGGAVVAGFWDMAQSVRASAALRAWEERRVRGGSRWGELDGPD